MGKCYCANNKIGRLHRTTKKYELAVSACRILSKNVSPFRRPRFSHIWLGAQSRVALRFIPESDDGDQYL